MQHHELDGFERFARRYALGVVMPCWIASGHVDYWLHRRSRIERTSGVPESALHVLGIGLSAIPSLVGLFCELDAGAIAVLAAGYVTHAGMTIWDVAYADGLRRVSPTEQHVHAMLELMPFAALSIVICLHPQQSLALLGRGTERPRFAMRRKVAPLDGRAVSAILVAFGTLVALPYAEEFRRCLAAARRDRGGETTGE